MRMIDADRLLDALNSIISDYTSEGKYPDGFGIDDAINLVEDAPTLTSQNEWVSVEERLPDKPGHYLVCTSVNYWHGGCMDKNVVSSNKGTTDGYVGTTLSVLDCFYDMTGDWNRVCNKHVTHWMSLSEPPNRRPPEGEEGDANRG